jgi:hypothetical protein
LSKGSFELSHDVILLARLRPIGFCTSRATGHALKQTERSKLPKNLASISHDDSGNLFRIPTPTAPFWALCFGGQLTEGYYFWTTNNDEGVCSASSCKTWGFTGLGKL